MDRGCRCSMNGQVVQVQGVRGCGVVDVVGKSRFKSIFACISTAVEEGAEGTRALFVAAPV